MTYPTRWHIGIRRYLGEVEGPKGTKIKTWADPQPTPVIAVYPTTSTEPSEAGRTIVENVLTILAPPGIKVSAYDRIDWRGDTYEVEGSAADWTTGPYRWAPGIEFQAKKVKG